MDEIEAVARGLYYAVQQPLQGSAPWYEKLPIDAREMLRGQARQGLSRIIEPSPGMMDAGLSALRLAHGATGEIDDHADVVRGIWQAMLGEVLKQPAPNGHDA